MVESEHTVNASNTDNNRRSRLQAVSVAIGLMVLALILSTVVGGIFAIPLFALGFDFDSTIMLVTLLLGGQLGFFAAGYLYARRYGLPIHLTRPDRRDLAYTLGGTIGALVFATGMSLVLEFIGLTPVSALEEFITEDPLVLIWLALLSVLVVAPSEEYLFRGVIQGRLKNTFTPAGAIIGASLLFGSMHFANWIGSPATIVGWALVIAGVGVIMGILYERTSNLFVPIMAHAVYNFFLFTVGYLLL